MKRWRHPDEPRFETAADGHGRGVARRGGFGPTLHRRAPFPGIDLVEGFLGKQRLQLPPKRRRHVHACDERQDHSLQATALVHEAYLRLVRDEGLQWSSRAEFYVAAGRAMQRILVEHARKRKRLKRRGDPRPIIADVVDLATTASLEDVVAVHDAIDRLEAEDPRAALVTRLRFFAGLTV